MRPGQTAVRAERHTGTVISPSVTGSMRELYGFELEPEGRDWLDGLSDSDYKRVDEVCGLLAEKGSELGGPWSDHLEGSVWELRLRLRDVAARVTYGGTSDGRIALLTVFPRPGSTSSGRSTGPSARRRPANATTAAPRRRLTKGRCEMAGYHTRWARPQDAADDPERIAIREALAFGKALYDIRTALGLTIAELAIRAAMTDDDIERIEEGGTEPTIPLLRRLAAALNANVRLTGGHDLGSVWFETHAA